MYLTFDRRSNVSKILNNYVKTNFVFRVLYRFRSKQYIHYVMGHHSFNRFAARRTCKAKVLQRVSAGCDLASLCCTTTPNAPCNGQEVVQQLLTSHSVSFVPFKAYLASKYNEGYKIEVMRI